MSIAVSVAARRMPFARITKQGLTSIAILVAILWGCIFAERHITRTTQLETYRALRLMRNLKLKRRVEPADQPKASPAPSSYSLGPTLG